MYRFLEMDAINAVSRVEAYQVPYKKSYNTTFIIRSHFISTDVGRIKMVWKVRTPASREHPLKVFEGSWLSP